MEISREIVEKHWHKAAVEALSQQYMQQGYIVARDAKLDNTTPDLYLEKDGNIIVIEVKSGQWSDARVKQVQQLRNRVVHQLGGKFNLVLASPPQDKNIQINNLETILIDVANEHLKGLSGVPAHARVTDVSDVSVSSVGIEENRIRVKGTGVALTMLEPAAPISNTGAFRASETVFPISFDMVLDGNLKPLETATIEIDVSSFYDDAEGEP